jgi:hypothetical protein
MVTHVCIAHGLRSVQELPGAAMPERHTILMLVRDMPHKTAPVGSA